MDSPLRHDASVAKTHRSAPRGWRTGLLVAAALTASVGGLTAHARGIHWLSGRAPVRVVPMAAKPAPAKPDSDEAKLATTLCALKDSVRWRTRAWTPPMCREIAAAVLTSAAKYRLSPALILGVMINESDLDENALTKYRKAGAVYAQDGGLMGIRCVFDGRGRCANGVVRGLTPRQTVQPARNIALGAQILALARAGDGVEKRVVRHRLPDGRIATSTKLVRCRHQSHAYWAHYNHGSFYISRGSARHYPHRVGVLYYALAQGLGLPHDELFAKQLTVADPGRRPRTADRPVEARFRTLCDKIYRATGLRTGAQVALASLEPQR